MKITFTELEIQKEFEDKNVKSTIIEFGTDLFCLRINNLINYFVAGEDLTDRATDDEMKLVHGLLRSFTNKATQAMSDDTHYNKGKYLPF